MAIVSSVVRILTHILLRSHGFGRGTACAILLLTLLLAPTPAQAYQQTDPDPDAQVQRLLVRGLTRLYVEDFQGAAIVLNEALKLDADNPTLLGSLARAEQGLNNVESARFYLSRALDLDPENVFFWHDWVSMAEAAQDYAAAVDGLQRVTLLPGATESDFLSLAALLADEQQFRQALEVVDRGLILFPFSVSLLDRDADLLEQTGESRALAERLESITDLDGISAVRHQRAAVAWLRAGEPGRAESLLDTLLELEPESRDAMSLMAAALEAQNRPAEAEHFARRADAVASDSETFQGRLTQEEMSGDSVEGLRALLEDEPGNTDLQIRLAVALHRSGAFEEAAARFEQVILSDVRNLDSWKGAIESHTASGNTADALRLSEEALMLFPGYVPLQIARVFALQKAGRTEEATDLAGNILTRDIDPRFEADVQRLREAFGDV